MTSRTVVCSFAIYYSLNPLIAEIRHDTCGGGKEEKGFGRSGLIKDILFTYQREIQQGLRVREFKYL